MGEVNLAKQTLFGNGRESVSMATLPEWEPFISSTRENGYPGALAAMSTDDVERGATTNSWTPGYVFFPDFNITCPHSKMFDSSKF